MTPTTRTIELLNDLNIKFDEYGAAKDGTGVIVLHGGAGPRSVAGFAEALSEHAYVIVPTHPGFDGTTRPDGTDTVEDLAVAYLDLIDELDLHDVMIIGSSIGGWIGLEMSLQDNHGRIKALVLLGSTGIKPEPPLEIADPAKLGPIKTGELAFYRPELRLDPATLNETQKAAMAANQRAQAMYAGVNYDPKLRGRLHRVVVPVLVLAGEHDGIVPPAYGRALADSLPRAVFHVIPEAGHFPHIEQPGAVFGALGDFVDNQVRSGEA
jgi:pimeloyl-ACP methyl ester carboxylesterase